tara:strand:+ start:15009 stop:15671 length:663 start_codon:yes stop_codon:yes gene_type:complete
MAPSRATTLAAYPIETALKIDGVNSRVGINNQDPKNTLDVVGVVSCTSLTATGNVNVGGVLTYADVTNVDSVGIVTARVGLKVLAGGIDMKGLLQEKCKITAGKLSDNLNIDLADGMVHHFTTTETTTATPNIRVDGTGTGALNDNMAVGDTISVTIITTAAAAGYSANFTIDGGAVTEKWVGGSPPSGGGSSGLDIYALQIIKTASATFTVIANLTNAA